MIAKDLKEEIASSIVPVLLGDGSKASLLALRLYLTLGTVSLRLGAHRHLWDLPGIISVFRTVADHERLRTEQLLDLFEEFDGYLLLLVPTDKHSRSFVERHRELLSSRFILSEPDEISTHIPSLNF